MRHGSILISLATVMSIAAQSGELAAGRLEDDRAVIQTTIENRMRVASQTMDTTQNGAAGARSLLVRIRFGESKPGTPKAGALLKITGMNLQTETDEHGEREIPGIPAGPVSLLVLVAGADPCTITIADAVESKLLITLFVRKRGLAKCERLTE